MHLAPITTRVNSQNVKINKQLKISFGSKDQQSCQDKFFNTYAACAATIALLSGAVVYKCAHDDLERSRENLNRIFDKYELQQDLYQVKRDTFMLEDETGDDFPELILYKNDGSKVVIDINEAKRLNSSESI